MNKREWKRRAIAMRCSRDYYKVWCEGERNLSQIVVVERDEAREVGGLLAEQLAAQSERAIRELDCVLNDYATLRERYSRQRARLDEALGDATGPFPDPTPRCDCPGCAP